MRNGISIVVPTFNRNEQLSLVLDHIFESDTSGLESVEVIVVDDGSATPARSLVEEKKTAPPFRLKYIYQDNAGPAEARNNGFAQAGHQIVLFTDDDILVTPELIKQHYLAHLDKPGSVIYGRAPYVVPQVETEQYLYLKMLANESADQSELVENSRYEKVGVVASGNISVEKRLFPHGVVYASGLKIPASEEFALALSLAKMQIPVYFAKDIFGWHLQPPTIKDSCKQNYKYGLGIAEVVHKMPEVLELGNVKSVYSHNRNLQAGDPVGLKVKKLLRGILGTRPIRVKLVSVSLLAERLGTPKIFLFRLFRLAIGSHFSAGIREGEIRFSDK